jgi:hypothetical protein
MAARAPLEYDPKKHAPAKAMALCEMMVRRDTSAR